MLNSIVNPRVVRLVR